jgi:hypothetical protein
MPYRLLIDIEVFDQMQSLPPSAAGIYSITFGLSEPILSLAPITLIATRSAAGLMFRSLTD